MPLAEAAGAICVQRFDGSRNSAIHTTYRISLRSSSIREPRYPLLRVVFMVWGVGQEGQHTQSFRYNRVSGVCWVKRRPAREVDEENPTTTPTRHARLSLVVKETAHVAPKAANPPLAQGERRAWGGRCGSRCVLI
jgi:hypothetical protein